IPFNQAVKLHSIKILAPKGMSIFSIVFCTLFPLPCHSDQAPATIRTFVNLPNTPSFDEAESMAPVETIELGEADYETNGITPLRFVKYQSVHSLTVQPFP